MEKIVECVFCGSKKIFIKENKKTCEVCGSTFESNEVNSGHVMEYWKKGSLK